MPRRTLELPQKQGPPWAAIGAVALILATLLAYAPAINAGFVWDDDAYLTDNLLLRDLDGLRRIWIPRETPQYYPAVFTMFWAEYQLWGEHPAGYHVINILLHILNALLVWRLAMMIGIPGGAAAGWLIAAVFALHPVHVESVAWITERKNVLSGFFYLAAMAAYLRFDGEGEKREAASHRAAVAGGGGAAWKWYIAAMALFVLALLSKTVTCSLPAALILVMLFQRKPITVKRLLSLAPFFIVGFALAMHTVAVERDHVGASGEQFMFTFAERLVIATQALLFYPWKIIFPWPLVFIYPRWEIDASSLASFWALGIVLVIGAAALWAYLRGRRGPALALAFYAGTVFPALGFFNVYPMLFSFVADHFQYLASLGVIALLVGGAAWWFARAGGGWRLVAFGSLPLVVFMMVTINQATLYRDAETLWQHTLSWNEPSWMPHNNMSKELLRRANALRAQGRGEEASALFARGFAHLARAMELNPRLAQAIVDADWSMHIVLAGHLDRQGEPDRAAEHYRAYLERFPHEVAVQIRLSTSLEAAGRYEEAVAVMRDAINWARTNEDRRTIMRRWAQAMDRYGMQLAAAGSYLEALEYTVDAEQMFRSLELPAEADAAAARVRAYLQRIQN